MNSRWQASKIGFINFWYYDEQEFPFVKGRMLLRGSNGSGKSVTMQSVIPLLLDGNLSPERLDPFGSRDRKMSSYLLEEEDGREERTAYLYMEFKRAESDTYLTIGMGIRARRGKPMDKWYFSLSDGRRIGKDFYLYRKTDEKVPLSKKELENRIENGGQIFDRQTDYMEYVNRQIFGFETLEEYKEMLDLLIQLRTPKLSRDFKPTVVNDILSDSLQPLSDEELRPMSEAIENMDAMTMNLKSRQEGRQAAWKIHRVLDRYNRLMLFEKARNLEENQKLLADLKKEEQEHEQTIRSCGENVLRLEKLRTDLDARKDALEKERDSLRGSDAVALKSREMDLTERLAGNRKSLFDKERQLEAKQDQYTQISAREKEEQDRRYLKEQDLEGFLEEMEEEAGDMAFGEHDFFAREFREKLETPLDFSYHQEQMEKTQEGVAKGLEILRQAELQRIQAEELLRRKEKKQREADGADRRLREQEGLMAQIQNEWKEALYSWNGNNKELKLSGEQMKTLSLFGEDYGEHSDFARVRRDVADVWLKTKGLLEQELHGKELQEQECVSALEAQRQELEAWENHREPEPPRGDAVVKNRQRLDELGIPFHELYKVLEFGENLDKEACDRLEEALLQMGILDALVVDEEYREQVLSMDPGSCDRYLFVQKGSAEKSLLDVLDFNDSVNDLFFNQKLIGILKNISYRGAGDSLLQGQEETAVIMSDGTYRLGVVTGTVTGEHEAGFLGTRARERNRQAKMAACREAIEQLEKERIGLQEEIEGLEGRLKVLEEEYEAFPGDEDLREAFRMKQDAEYEYTRLREEENRIGAEFQEVSQKLQSMRREALKIAEKLGLSCSLAVFEQADRAARSYSRLFYQLKSGHEAFLQMAYRLKELKERLEDLDGDLDQIRYEKNSLEQEGRKLETERTSVLEQLALTDYEDIQARLDACLSWLRDYPRQLRECEAERAQSQERIRVTEEFLERDRARIQEGERKGKYLDACYQAERALGCVEFAGGSEASPSETVRFLAGECRDMKKDTINQELNRVYFENRSFLNEYQPMQRELFGELEETAGRGDPSPRRLDIRARYQGVEIPFYKLLNHLEEDIAELQELIRDGDRELFEDILSNIVSRRIRAKINASNAWVDRMNALMGAMNTSSGLQLSLRWRSRTAESEDQLDTRELVELLKKDYRLMREEEAEKLSLHFRSKVEEARRRAQDSGGMISFYQVMKDTLDYRKWFEFQLFFQKKGDRQKELTNSVFGTFSGGEKAMSMYVPLFSAVVAKYGGGRKDAPRLISLDEAFAGVDNKNIRDMFRLMTEFEFDFIINSQVLWGDCDTLDALAIYQLLRPENARFITVMPYFWNGRMREMLENEQELELRREEISG